MTTLDHLVQQLAQKAASPLKSRTTLADTIGKITYSIPVGLALDYFKSGLRGWGIVSSRAFATVVNLFTGYPYGKWREGWYRLTGTTEESSPLRKGLVELGAVNTFETYVYGTAICVGSLIQKGEINYWDVQSGMEGLMILSPFIGPTMGLWLDGTRRLFKVKPAAAGAYHQQKSAQ